MFRAEIEGTEMVVCEACSKFGKVKTRFKTRPELKVERKRVQVVEQRKIESKKEILFLIVDDYASRVKNARERMKLKQEDVAKKTALKESLIHNIESGKFEPSMKTARILEKFFKINLIEQHEEEHEGFSGSGNEGLTLGDMIKIRKR